jgi:hypothetical protein
MPGFWKNTRTCLFSLVAVFLFSSTALGQTWKVTTSPGALTIYPGQQNVALSVTVGSSAYAGPISVTLSGLPSGITVSPLTLTAGSSGTLYLNASVSAGNEGFYGGFNADWTAPVTVVAAAGAEQATSQLPLTVSVSNASFAPAAAAINLPIVRIDTGGAGILDKTTLVPGTITITSPDGQTSYLPNSGDADNSATFHLHGHITLSMPKLSYKVKLNTSLDLLSTMGLSCGYVTGKKATPACDKSKSYILLANYDDKTLLRDWAASALANAIPIGNSYLNSPANSPSPSGTSTLMPWAPHSLFVELYLNGVYEGNYQLIEEVKVDSHRVNIDELEETDVSDVTGGYLMEIDAHKDEAFIFATPLEVFIGLEDPDFSPDPEVPEQTSYISNYMNTAETALFSSNFTDPVLGWRAYFDEASAVNFYIVNDLMGNVDGGSFYSSDYLYKNKDNPLLYMGPVWDFDVSSGNVNYKTIMNPTVPWMQEQSIWYERWFSDPGFKADVVTQWNALKNNGVFAAWLASIQTQAAALQQSQANNFGRWPMQGVEIWPNAQAAGSYDGEVRYLTNWLQLRMAYLDSQFNNKAQTSTTLQIGSATPRSGSPITLTAQVTGSTTLSGTVSFLSNGVLLGSASLSGSTATLTTSALPAGANSLQAVYSGDGSNGLSSSTELSVNVASPLLTTVVSLSVPATVFAGTATSFTASIIPNAGTAIPTGTVTFNIDGGSGAAVSLDASGTANFSIAFPTAGTHTVNAIYSGDSTYSTSTGSSSVIAAAAPAAPISTVVNLSIPATAIVGESTSITASVVPGTGPGIPTGTVTFSIDDGSGTAVVLDASGQASYSATFAKAGAHSVRAAYSGDTHYAASTGSSTVNVGDGDFSFTISGTATQAMGFGSVVTYAFSIAPHGTSYPGTVTFAASGLPPGTTASFSQSSLAATVGAQTITMTIQGASSAQRKEPMIGHRLAPVTLALLLLPLFGTGRLRRQGRRMGQCLCLLILLGIVATVSLSGCGGSETAKVYPITVTATSGSLTHQCSVTVTEK